MNRTSLDVQKDVLESPVPVLVDFGAEWCGPCKMIAPAVEQLATELQGKAKVVTIDVDEQNEIAARYVRLKEEYRAALLEGERVERAR